MHIYNSLSRTTEEFSLLQGKQVSIYACGPTVYFYPQIGNWRTFVLGDLVARTMQYLGYKVHYLMNITDVGHLTGDNLGDADTGEDRLEKAALKEGKTAWDIAKFYTDDFMQGYQKLNLTMPTLENGKIGFCVATDHIAEQIEMIQKIESKGFAYKTSDGVYFDIQAYEQAGNLYGRMSNIHKDNLQARVEPNPEKRDERDFALWKFSYPQGRDFDPQQNDESKKRHMEWASPWGLGYPGWHIECSAMSSKYLGEQFDIHIGGEDHKSTHHPAEIAQAEAASGKKPFVKYWLHGAFLKVDGKRMGKSLGNAYTLHDIEAKGFNLLALRYFYYSAHYSKTLNFTWEALENAQNSLENIYDKIRIYKSSSETSTGEELLTIDKLRNSFVNALNSDLQIPVALVVVWEVIKDIHLSESNKLKLLLEFDQVLALGFDTIEPNQVQIPMIVQQLSEKRSQLKEEKRYQEADQIREQIRQQGFEVEDTSEGVKVRKLLN